MSFLVLWSEDMAHNEASTYADNKGNTEERGHTSMPRARFEPAIPVFLLSKTTRASDRAAKLIK